MDTLAVDLAAMLSMQDKKFSAELSQLNMEDVVTLIGRLQQEMSEEQEDFNALREELANCDVTDGRRRQEIQELMAQSQERLTDLMNKMALCFKSQEANTAKLISKQNFTDTSNGSPEISSIERPVQSKDDLVNKSSTERDVPPPPPLPGTPAPGSFAQRPAHSQSTSQQKPVENSQNGAPTQGGFHKSNVDRLNKLVSSHKAPIANKSGAGDSHVDIIPTPVKSQVSYRSDQCASAPTEKAVVRNQVDISVATQPANEKSQKTVATSAAKKPVSNGVTVKGDIAAQQSKAEPVKLRSTPKEPTPIKRLSVADSKSLFESNTLANESEPNRRSWSRGSGDFNREDIPPPQTQTVAQSQMKASSMVDLSQGNDKQSGGTSMVPTKDSNPGVKISVNNSAATGAKAPMRSLMPTVRKAWDKDTKAPANSDANQAIKTSHSPKLTHSTKQTAAPPPPKVAVSATIVPQPVAPVNKSQAPPQIPVSKESQAQQVNGKSPSKVALRSKASDTEHKAILPNKDLLRDIKLVSREVKPPQAEVREAGNVTGNDENEAPARAVHLKPISVRPPKTDAPLRQHSNSSKGSVTPAIELKAPDDCVPLALTSPMTKDSEGFTADDMVQDRVTLKQWDPTPVLEELYEIKLNPDSSETEMTYINLEGYMEKLPVNKKKTTLLKTWKKRYFKAFNGNLYYFESSKKPKKGPEDLEKATGCLPLGGGRLEHLGERMLGIDDGCGRYLVVRCLNDKDYEKWAASLNSQIATDVKVKWVRPLLSAQPHPNKKVVIIDLGSCSVRAGILGEAPNLPQLFFPAVIAVEKQTRMESVGLQVAKPSVRASSDITFPVRPTVKIDKFSLKLEVMPVLFRYIFQQLKINPKDYWVMFSAPANFTDKIKEVFMDILVKTFNVRGANIVNQTVLALYSYNSMSGIVVDIGERLEIVPVTDGYIVEQGVSRQPYGGHAITQALNNTFTEKRYRFFTDVEFQIVRLAMEKMCFVADNYSETLKDCNKNPEKYRKSIDMTKYDLPKGSWTHVTNDVGRFKSTEGMFNFEVWGIDNPPLQKLIQTAVHASPMDTRREMWRSIYLSGGVTMLPGFVERLKKEVMKLAPPNVPVEIHASPQRYHAAYIGACALAGMSVFEQSCISAEEWKKHGASILRKWHMY